MSATLFISRVTCVSKCKAVDRPTRRRMHGRIRGKRHVMTIESNSRRFTDFISMVLSFIRLNEPIKTYVRTKRQACKSANLRSYSNKNFCPCVEFFLEGNDNTLKVLSGFVDNIPCDLKRNNQFSKLSWGTSSRNSTISSLHIGVSTNKHCIF